MVARHSRSALSRLGVVQPGDPGWFDSDGSKALGARYRPQPHDAPLVVFAATESSERFGSAALGWESSARRRRRDGAALGRPLHDRPRSGGRRARARCRTA